MSAWSMPRHRWIAMSLIVVLSVASTAGLHSITDEWTFLVPAAMGALTGASAFVIADRWRLLPGETLAVALGLFVVGGVLAVSIGIGEAPSLASVGDFFDGLIRTWADLLSAVTPADLTPRLSVAPYAIAWFGTVIGCSLLRWSPLPTAPVLGPLVGLGIMVLLTDEERGLSILVGAAIAVGALLLGLFLDPGRRLGSGSAPADETDVLADVLATESTTSTSPHARTIRVALVIGAVAILAPLVGPRLPLAEANERYDLRDEVVPPWDPLSLPSPLVQLKASLAAEREDEVVFTVESDTPIERWTTAAMTSYDGVVWTVADPDDAGSDFRPVGSRLPAPDAQPASDPTVTARVTIDALTGPWVPVPGAARTVQFEGTDVSTAGDASAGSPRLVENARTNTLAVTSGVDEGLTYTVIALVPPDLTDDELRADDLAVVSESVDLEALPPQIRNLAADVTEGIDHGWGQIAAIRDLFSSEGFYDKTTRVPPGHSYFRLAQFLDDPDQIVGYEEQYAAAAALIARIADLPVRVAVGFEIEPERYVDGVAEVRAGDASAWIEVRVDGVGWVPVSVSPPRSREPQSENSVTSEDQVATPNPPPPPQVPPDVDVFSDNDEVEEPVEEDEEDDDTDEETAGAGLGTLGWALVGTGTATLLLLGAAGAIVAWKQRRTRRRREAPDTADRVAGAWLELTDRYEEAGVSTDRHATPLESVHAMAASEPAAVTTRTELVGLARQVDRAAYDRVPPPPEAADTAWRYSDDAVDALLAGRSLPRRTRMRLDPRPLLRRDPFGASGTTMTRDAPIDEADTDGRDDSHDGDDRDDREPGT